MKVLLVDPPGINWGLNVGLGYLAASLKNNGHSAKVLDFNNGIMRADARTTQSIGSKLIETCITYRPDLVGFSVHSVTIKSTIDLISRLREVYKGLIVLGGPQIAIEDETILRENPYVDLLVIGDGEETLCELVSTLEEGGDLSKVKGIVYRQDAKILKNERRPPLLNLDSLPFPDYESFGVERIDRYPLLTSRGCPFNCIFCLSAVLSGRTWRPRKPECLIEELKHTIKKYKTKSFSIMDDNFTLDMKRAERFCDLLIQEKLNLKWYCLVGIRADRLNVDLVRKMKEAGCQEVGIGIESLVPEVFKNVSKGESMEDIKKAVKLLKKFDIKVNGFFIIGLPSDTFEKTMKSYQKARELGLDSVFFQLLVPFPKTQIWEWIQAAGRTHFDYRDARFSDAIFDTPEFPKQERERAFEILTTKTKFYNFDLSKSNLWNIRKIIGKIIRYDLGNLPFHIPKLTNKGMEVLFRSREEALASIKFGEDRN